MSFHRGRPFKSLIPLTPLCGIVLQADPLAAAFAVLRQELLLLITMDAHKIPPSCDTVLIGCSPALLLGPVHVVEELQGIIIIP